MNIFPALLILIVGIVLLYFGVTGKDSIPDAFSRLFTGEYTNRTVLLLVGGGLLTLIGLAGCYQSRRA